MAASYEEIVLSDSEDEEPQPPMAPASVFVAGVQPHLLDESIIDPTSEMSEHVYPEHPVILEVPEEQEPDPPSEPVPDVLNPFSCNFEELNQLIYGKANNAASAKKPRTKHPPKATTQSRHKLTQMVFEAAAAKAQLDLLGGGRSTVKTCSNQKTAFTKTISSAFNYLDEVDRKELAQRKCSVHLECLTLDEMIKKHASRSSIDYFIKSSPLPAKSAVGFKSLAYPEDHGKNRIKVFSHLFTLIDKESTASSFSDRNAAAGVCNAEVPTMKSRIQSKLAQLINGQHSESCPTSSSSAPGKVTPALRNSHIACKDLKVLLKDLKYFRTIRIGNRITPVSEIIAQLNSREASMKDSYDSQFSNSSDSTASSNESSCTSGTELADITESNLSQCESKSQSAKGSKSQLSQDFMIHMEENWKSKPESFQPRLRIRKDLFAPASSTEPPSIANVTLDSKQDTKGNSPVEEPQIRGITSTCKALESPIIFKDQLKTKLSERLSSLINTKDPTTHSCSDKEREPTGIKGSGGLVKTTNHAPKTMVNTCVGQAEETFLLSPKTNSSASKENQPDHLLSASVQRPSKSGQQVLAGVLSDSGTIMADTLNNNLSKQPGIPCNKSRWLEEKNLKNSPDKKQTTSALSPSIGQVAPNLPYEKTLSSAISSKFFDFPQNSRDAAKSTKEPSLSLKSCAIVLEDCKKLLKEKASDRKGLRRFSVPSEEETAALSSNSAVNQRESTTKSPNSTSSTTFVEETEGESRPVSPESMEASKQSSFEEVRKSQAESPVRNPVNLQEVRERNRSESPISKQGNESTFSSLGEESRSATPDDSEDGSNTPEVEEARETTVEDTSRPELADSPEPSVSVLFQKLSGKWSKSTGDLIVTSKSSQQAIGSEKRCRSPEDGDGPKKKSRLGTETPNKIISAIFDVTNKSIPSSVMKDILSVDGTFDLELTKESATARKTARLPSWKRKRKGNVALARQIFGLKLTCGSIRVSKEFLSLNGSCSGGSYSGATSCHESSLSDGKTTQRSHKSENGLNHFEMQVFDIVGSIPLCRTSSEYHLDGNLDSEISDDEVLIGKKTKLKAKNVIAKKSPKKTSRMSKKERNTGRNPSDSSVSAECSVILNDITVDPPSDRIMRKSFSPANVHDTQASSQVQPTKCSPEAHQSDKLVDEKLSAWKPVIKVMRLNYEKVKDGISVVDFGKAPSTSIRSTSVSRRKQGKPRKYGFNLNRNGGVKNPSKLISDLHFMVRNPKKRTK